MKFVQIGGYVANDHVFEKVKNENVELGIIVEPLDFLNSQIEKCYENVKNIIIENIIIVPVKESESVDFFIYDNNDNFEISSVNKEHLLKVGPLEENMIKKLNLKCCSITELFNKYSITDLDYLFIDAEGLDIDILMSIELKNFNIKNIIFEHHHASGPNKTKGEVYDKVVNHLQLFGYKIKDYDSLNTLATYEN